MSNTFFQRGKIFCRRGFAPCAPLVTGLLMIRKKWITSTNKIDSCNHICSLCTDGAPTLREVRFYNCSEQADTARHFYCLCTSLTCTCKLSLSRMLENSFEARSWTCEFYQGTGVFFSNCLLKMIWLIFSVNKYFIPNSYLVTVTFLNLGVDWAKSVLRCLSARLKLVYLF